MQEQKVKGIGMLGNWQQCPQSSVELRMVSSYKHSGNQRQQEFPQTCVSRNFEGQLPECGISVSVKVNV